MLLHMLLSMLVCTGAWAEPSIQTVSPYHLPPGRAAEIRMQVPDRMNHQFVIMPADPGSSRPCHWTIVSMTWWRIRAVACSPRASGVC